MRIPYMVVGLKLIRQLSTVQMIKAYFILNEDFEFFRLNHEITKISDFLMTHLNLHL